RLRVARLKVVAAGGNRFTAWMKRGAGSSYANQSASKQQWNQARHRLIAKRSKLSRKNFSSAMVSCFERFSTANRSIFPGAIYCASTGVWKRAAKFAVAVLLAG